MIAKVLLLLISCVRLLTFFFPPKRYVKPGIPALFMRYIIPPWQAGTGMLATGMNFRHALVGKHAFCFEFGGDSEIIKNRGADIREGASGSQVTGRNPLPV